MRRRIPEVTLAPNESLVRLTWPAGPDRHRPRSVYCIKDRGWRTTWRRVWVDAAGVTHRAWSRRNTYQTERAIATGRIIEEPVWQRPYAVSEGL